MTVSKNTLANAVSVGRRDTGWKIAGVAHAVTVGRRDTGRKNAGMDENEEERAGTGGELTHTTTTTTTTTTTRGGILNFVYLLERFLPLFFHHLRVVEIYRSGYSGVRGFLFLFFFFSTFCRAVAEGGGVRPLLCLLYLVYVLSFFLVTAYD